MLLDVGGEDEAPHIAPRREHNAFAPVRREALHCYGVDFLSNKEVLEVFAAFEPQGVEWLDDSSCNVVFACDDAPPRVLKELAAPTLAEGGPPMEHWTKTRPLTVGKAPGKEPQKQHDGKARQRNTLRTFCLELRCATEADRKDPGHSGHTDSAYYAHVKEQQAIQKQQMEERRMKKRQRRSRLPSGAGPELAPAAAAAEAASGQGGASGSGAAAPGGEQEGQASAPGAAPGAEASGAPLPRLGPRGPLDPLLYLRAGAGAGNSGGEAGGEAGQAQRKNEDLLSALRRAEAEYTAVVQPEGDAKPLAGAGAPASAGGKGERGRPRSRPLGGTNSRQATPGRGRRRTPGGAGRRERTPARPGQDGAQQEQQQRGKKRRPVEQEPRAVSAAAAPARKVLALPEVEAFLAEKKVRCQRYQLKLTFRSITFGQQKKAKGLSGGKPAKVEGPAEAKAGQAAEPPADAAAKMEILPEGKQTGEKDKENEATGKQATPIKKELPPWERYLQANHHFVQHGQFMHTVAWDVEGRCVLTVVPHPTRVDQDRLARAVQKPRGAIRQKKLKDIEQMTGWPVFVCPPIGHPKDAQGRQPLLLVDSAAVELKRPLLFDCGTVGLSIPSSEFFRCTGAACIEGLAKDAPREPALAPAVLGGPGGAPAQAPTASSSPEPAPEPGPAAAPAQAMEA